MSISDAENLTVSAEGVDEQRTKALSLAWIQYLALRGELASYS